MKNMLLAVGLLCATAFVIDAHAEGNTKVENHRNVRVLLEITEGEKPPVTFAIVGSQGRLRLNNIANLVQINGGEVPTILSFDITLRPQEETLYSIEYSYGFQMPIVIGTVVGKDGKKSSRYEYKDLGASGTVNMKIGDQLEILKDPKRSVVLKLEGAGNSTEK
ncbi:hypothetical protein P4C99_16860 [Pontiellaceae bacterium B1224]|nr:hypothetical protein [Pontiellaceae bacterium B1224]